MFNVICITGNIASGKDLASNYLKKYFDLYLDVDKLAKNIFEQRILQIQSIFNTYSRTEISKIAFSDIEKMIKLEQIIHPLLRKKIISIILNNKINNKTDFNILINCAIIFKLKLEFFCDYIIAIDSKKEIRLKRLIEKRGFTEEKALNAIKYQTDINLFRKKINYLIDNNTDIEQFYMKLDKIIKIINNK